MLQNNFQGREMLFCNKETEARVPCNPNEVKVHMFIDRMLTCRRQIFRWMFNTPHLFMKNLWTIFLNFKGNLIQLLIKNYTLFE